MEFLVIGSICLIFLIVGALWRLSNENAQMRADLAEIEPKLKDVERRIRKYNARDRRFHSSTDSVGSGGSSHRNDGKEPSKGKSEVFDRWMGYVFAGLLLYALSQILR